MIKNSLKFFLALVGIQQLAVLFAMEYGDEWKKSCSDIIEQLSLDSAKLLRPKKNGFNYDSRKSLKIEKKIIKSLGISRSKIHNWKKELGSCYGYLKMHFEELTKKVDEMKFISIFSKKDNNIVNKNNSYFVNSLSELMRYYEEKNADDNLEKVKMLIGQFRADFNSLIIEIGLMKIEEYAVANITAEDVDEICIELKDIETFLGSDWEVAFQAKKQLDDIINEKGQKTIKIVKYENNNYSIDTIEWDVSVELDKRIKQILVEMTIKIRHALYEKDFNRKIDFLVQSPHVHMDEIKAISEIFKQKFRDFCAYLTINGDASKHEILRKLAKVPKEIELLTWEQIANKISTKAVDMATEPLNGHTNEIREAFQIPEEDISIPQQGILDIGTSFFELKINEIPEEDISIPQQGIRDIGTSFFKLKINEDKKLEKKCKYIQELSDLSDKLLKGLIMSTVEKNRKANSISQKEDKDEEHSEYEEDKM